jgi:hypothetical protein
MHQARACHHQEHNDGGGEVKVRRESLAHIPRMGVLLLLIVLVFISNLQGRQGATANARAACKRGILERVDTIHEQDVHITGNYAVARDPRQPAATRSSRWLEAREEEAIREDRYTRVDPAHGGKLVCDKVDPEPSLLALP